MPPRKPNLAREIPDIDYDPIAEFPDTVQYTQDPDELQAADADEFAKIKAARKKRIEAAARAYLGGGRVFILTAGLKGPFNKGWTNPWSTAKKRKRGDGCAEADPAPKRARKYLRSTEFVCQTPWKSKIPTPQKASTPVDPFQPVRLQDHPQPSPQEKVQSWLHRNGRIPLQGYLNEPQSPTPKRQRTEQTSPRASRGDKTPIKQVIAVSSQEIRAPMQELDPRVLESFDTVVRAKHHSQPMNTHSRLQDALGSEPTSDAGDTSSAIVEAPARAEAAIILMKRASEARLQNQSHHAPACGKASSDKEMQRPANPRQSSPRANQFLAAAAPNAHIKINRLEESIGNAVQEPNSNLSKDNIEDPADNAALGNANAQQALATSSDKASTSLLPSAQVHPGLLPSTSNISSGAVLLSTVIGLAPIPDHTEKELDTSTAAITSQFESALVQEDNIVHDELGDEPSTAEGVNEHEHLPDETPGSPPGLEDFVTAQSSRRVSQTGSKTPQSQSPPARKGASSKRKAASFADDCSATAMGSIKNALKVQKANRTAPSSPRKANLNSSRRKSPRQTPKKATPGILKSSNSKPSTVGVRGSAISSPRASRQRPTANSSRGLLQSGQNGLLDQLEDSFDIEEALDEMGSFLSTWHDEKNNLRV